MDTIPNAWPAPEEEQETLGTYPLFALPDAWLFPYAILPLHVFEPRYRQMVDDSLDGPGRIVVGTVETGEGEDLSGSPPVHPVAGLGEIGRHDRLPDGRYHILLVGLKRVRVREVESDRLYRRVEVEPLPEIMVPREREAALRSKLVEAIHVRTDGKSSRSFIFAGTGGKAGKLEIPKDVPVSYLADMLLMALMPLPHDLVNELYSELDPERRAKSVLDEHERRSSE